MEDDISDQIKNGGPAFPLSQHPDLTPATDMDGNETGTGMSLRDHFAGQAIGSVVRQCSGDAVLGFPEGIESLPQLFALRAYEIADAMLAERAKGQPADLLRDATPAMLEALKNWATETRAYMSPECEEDPIVGPLLKATDAAVAKARGETSPHPSDH